MKPDVLLKVDYESYFDGGGRRTIIAESPWIFPWIKCSVCDETWASGRILDVPIEAKRLIPKGSPISEVEFQALRKQFKQAYGQRVDPGSVIPYAVVKSKPRKLKTFLRFSPSDAMVTEVFAAQVCDTPCLGEVRGLAGYRYIKPIITPSWYEHPIECDHCGRPVPVDSDVTPLSLSTADVAFVTRTGRGFYFLGSLRRNVLAVARSDADGIVKSATGARFTQVWPSIG